MYFIYILYSELSYKYYVGYSEDPHRRLEEHNSRPFNTYTSKHRPWVLKAIFKCSEHRNESMEIEKYIKKQKSRQLVIDLINSNKLPKPLAQLVRVPHMRD